MKPTGIVLYDGPSLINGEQIIMVVNGFKRSQNRKTGNMLQSWILCAKDSPLESNKSGADFAICGTCKHRHFRSCYVNLCHGPEQVHDGWKRGIYETDVSDERLSELIEGKHIRLGAYGEPTAVPAEIWKRLTKLAAGWTGYTHRWKVCSTEYREFCMASADTYDEAIDALVRGWKPFYVRDNDAELPPAFYICPASEEGGKRTTCKKCNVCKGGKAEGGKFPSIKIHGNAWKIVYYYRGMKRLLSKKSYAGIGWKH